MSTKKNKNPGKSSTSLKTVRPSGKNDSNFFELVHEVARQIPYGRVTSYGAIAACLGAKSSSRMVGWAMNNAHTAIPPVPAHRVVNRNGLLTGKHHFPSETAMEELLAKEGIRVENNKVVEWKELFWDPASD
jgi:methylated-DNA-protein-cysteine methyltransferase related protein